MITGCWRYGVLFCNSLMVFGVYYFYEMPIALQNEILNSEHSFAGSNKTGNQTNCKVCLGLGEVRFNLLLSITRWTSVAVCLPSGFLIDRLGNGRSLILFSILPLVGSVMFAVGAMSHAPVTTPMYIMMVAGFSLMTFGDGPLRFVQTRVISHNFPEATFTALVFTSFGYSGQGLCLLVTPYIATTLGFIPSLWIAVVACGFGVVCAVVLAFLLQLQKPDSEQVFQNYKMLTLKELQALPFSYWLYIMSIAFSSLAWLVPQFNLPDYLKLRHGYTMEEASHIIALTPLMFLLNPAICVVLKKIDCDGIMTTLFHLMMVVACALWGFCPAVSVFLLAIVDGIGIGILTVLMWQLLVALCPARYVGTLGAFMYCLRNGITALTFLPSGYILQRQKMTNLEDALDSYNHFFLMLVIMSSMGVICGAIMNVLDIRKACTLNSRIARWRRTNMETIGLMSMTEPSSQYCGTDGVNNNTTERDDPSVKSKTCKEN